MPDYVRKITLTQKPMKNNGAYLPSSFNTSLYLGAETRTLNGSELSSMWRASANRLIINKYLMLPNLAIAKSQILIYCRRLSISFQSHTHHIVYCIRINKAIYLPVSFKSQAFFITLQPKWTMNTDICLFESAIAFMHKERIFHTTGT